MANGIFAAHAILSFRITLYAHVKAEKKVWIESPIFHADSNFIFYELIRVKIIWRQ